MGIRCPPVTRYMRAVFNWEREDLDEHDSALLRQDASIEAVTSAKGRA